jgi:Quinolinate synthetase A protein
MSDNVAVEYPDIEFLRPCNLCPHMKRITLPAIRRALETLTHEVTIDQAVAMGARAGGGAHARSLSKRPPSSFGLPRGSPASDTLQTRPADLEGLGNFRCPGPPAPSVRRTLGGLSRPVGPVDARGLGLCDPSSIERGYALVESADVTSSVNTLKPASMHGPNEVTIATSVASRPRAIKIRPMRGLLWRASNVYQRPPR